MTPYIADADFVLYLGDALDVLAKLPDESIDCCVTSPPYWGLRDYGTAEWTGGSSDCSHLLPLPPEDSKQITNVGSWAHRYRDTCRDCGATRVDAQLGLEATPDEYVAKLVALFEQVRRLLRPSGTLWLNLGDTYAAKQLVGIPHRVAFALQASGWLLRADVVWSKPNQFPEAVTDRPTKAHEYVFMLTRSSRYYFAQDDVREPHARLWNERNGGTMSRSNPVEAAAGRAPQGEAHRGPYPLPNPKGRNVRSVWSFPTAPLPDAHFATFPIELPRRCIMASCPPAGTVLDPFMGSGTTALAARELGRSAVGVELSDEYAALCARRTQQLSLTAPEQLSLALP